AAALAFVMARRLPLVARLVGAAVALYGVAALAQGAAAGVTFSAMTRGEGLWQPLPWWLRGAFIGGCVVLPMAALVQAVKTGSRGWRRPGGTAWRELNEALVYALCAATAFSTWMPFLQTSRQTGGRATSAASTPLAEPLAPSAGAAGPTADLGPVAAVNGISALADRIARVDWDVAARAAVLGPGVEPAFAYVRDAIRYEAYPGVLRGANGTYTARAGNTPDRALLLAALLASKKIPTRFAIGTLDASGRERLWQRLFDTSIPGIPRPASSATGNLRQRVYARAAHDYGVVQAALGQRLPPVTKPTREGVLAEMNPHVWVEAEVDGRWIDLDPSFPDSTPGSTSTAVAHTVSALPADLYQTVTVRLKVEELSHGGLTQTTVLDTTANAVDLIDRQIFVAHIPGKPIAMANIGASLGGYVTWTPALWVGGEFTYGTTFTIDEAGSQAPAVDAAQPAGSGEGGLAGAIDALSARPPGTASSAAAPTGPVFVAESLELELRAPGGQPEMTRRTLVDRGSAAWRAKRPLAASDLPRLERGDQGPTAMRAMHNVWFSAGPHNLADYADAVQDLALKELDGAFPEDRPSPAGAGAGAGEDEPEFSDGVWPFALQNFAWLIWTDHGAIPRLNDTPGLRFYAARPRISIFTRMADRSGAIQIVTDLRRDDLRAVAAPSIAPDVVAGKKLWFGLVQGAFEHEMLADTIAASGGDRTAVETTSARLGSDGVVVLAPGDSLPSGSHAPQAESAARLSAALSEGKMIVAPVGALDGRGAWWEIAAGSGETAAVGALELHAGRAGYNPNYDLPKNGKPVQQNPFGGQKPNYTPEAAKEARDAQRAANNAKRSADYARNYQRQQNQLGRQAQSQKPGDEYGTLVAVMMVVGAVAYTIVGLAVLYVTVMAAEAAMADLAG
ncbi:MAG: transglutaminase domain-containing protein, partial [Acidobacteriota bacterium]